MGFGSVWEMGEHAAGVSAGATTCIFWYPGGRRDEYMYVHVVKRSCFNFRVVWFVYLIARVII